MGVLCVHLEAAFGATDPLAIWHPRTLPFDPSSLEQVVFGNGVFVAQGNPSTVFSSTDGIIWFRQLMPSGPSGFSGSLQFFGSRFHLSGAALASSNGVTWLLETSPTPGPVAFGNGVYVGIYAGNSDYSISTNGQNWVAQLPIASLRWLDVAFGNGRFVAVGESGFHPSTL